MLPPVFLLLLLSCFPFLTVPAEAWKDVTIDTCGLWKGCLSPAICTDSSCDFLATWKIVLVDSVEYVEFELKGVLKRAEGYISLGFSKDSMIGDDDVVGCYHQAATDAVVIRAAYTTHNGKSSVFYSEPDSRLLIVDGEDLGGEYNAYDNTIQCRFRRRAEPLNSKNKLVDLTRPNQYYLVVSRGDDVLSSGFDRPFPGGESISHKAIELVSPVYGSMTGIGYDHQGSLIMKAHGCLMVLAWVLCASVGVILSRYYKEMWPNGGLLRQHVWFQSHRILQGCCVALTCIAIILAFIFCGGYSSVSTSPYYIHPILGLIVFVLALLNPLISFCRCNPNNDNRPWFNWIHFFIGTFAHVLSVPTMMLGLRMPAAGLQLQSLNYPLWILVFFVIFQFCVEIILELHGCLYYRRNKNKNIEYERMLNNYHAAMHQGPQVRPLHPEPSGRMFKYFMIGLHGTACAIVAVVLVIIIAVN